MKIKLLFLFILAVFVCSCVEADNPLSDPDKAVIDNRLEGVWIAKKDEAVERGIIYYHFTSRDDGFMDLMVMVVDCTESFGTEVNFFRMFSTKLDTKRYMNVKDWCPKEQKLSGGYKFHKYEISDDILSLWFMLDVQPIAKAIDSGSLHGKVYRKGENNIIDKVKITDSSENIAQFVLLHDQELFKDSVIQFKKIQEVPKSSTNKKKGSD